MKYIVTQAVQLPTGTLVKFNEAQAARRGNQLANVKGKQYECLCPVWVKAGEIIDLDEPAKHLLASLEAQSGKPAAPEKVFVPPAAAAVVEVAAAPPADLLAGDTDSVKTPAA